MRFDRKLDYKRAQNEDPEVIQGWFDFIRNTIAKYRIYKDDIHNFNKTGFMIGVGLTTKVITASEGRARPKLVQQGDREWVTVIQGIYMAGWAIPPFIVFAGTYYLAAWYSEELPPDWVISMSENGWIINESGFQWFQHFEKHTAGRIKGTKRLLVLDGHKSHNSV